MSYMLAYLQYASLSFFHPWSQKRRRKGEKKKTHFFIFPLLSFFQKQLLTCQPATSCYDAFCQMSTFLLLKPARLMSFSMQIVICKNICLPIFFGVCVLCLHQNQESKGLLTYLKSIGSKNGNIKRIGKSKSKERYRKGERVLCLNSEVDQQHDYKCRLLF